MTQKEQGSRSLRKLANLSEGLVMVSVLEGIRRRFRKSTMIGLKRAK